MFWANWFPNCGTSVSTAVPCKWLCQMAHVQRTAH